MQYTSNINDKKTKESYQHFCQRVALYKHRGLDFMGMRSFILKKAGPLEEEILELGAGNGYTTLSLARAGYRLKTTDLDKESLDTTAARLSSENLLSQVELYLTDGKTLPFLDKSFSNVVVVNLFHHLNSPDDFLKEADRVLKESGLMLLADFDEVGLKILDDIHREEGGMHTDTGTGKEDVQVSLKDLGYDLKEYNFKGHWIVIAKKGSSL